MVGRCERFFFALHLKFAWKSDCIVNEQKKGPLLAPPGSSINNTHKKKQQHIISVRGLQNNQFQLERPIFLNKAIKMSLPLNQKK